MDEKASLLDQLRIDRGEEVRGGSGRNGPGRGSRGWRVAAGVCALVALLAVAAVAWLLLHRAGATPAAVGSAASAADASDAASAAAAGSDAAGAAISASPPAGAGASVLDASGYIVAQRQSTVSAKTTGRLRELLIEEGQYVKAGQVVARLDDSNTLAAVAQARAQLTQAEANLTAARTALADARPIFVRNRQEHTAAVISAQDFDTAKSAFDAARSNVPVQEAAVAAARANLLVAERFEDDTIVRAPFSGVVTNKAAQPGDIVSPVSAGGGFTQTGICTIVDMDSLEADVDVSENFINRVHPGQPAVVRLNAYPDWDIPASVIAIVPTADRSKATVKVRVGFKVKDARILPEMGARVSFLAEPGKAKGEQSPEAGKAEG